MDDKEFEDYINLRNKQFAGEVRYFKGVGDSGWFAKEPKQEEGTLHYDDEEITEVTDLSDQPVGQTNKRYPKGSFAISLKTRDGLEADFILSHPEDTKEFLDKMGVTDPNELVGRSVQVYSTSLMGTVVGVDLSILDNPH